jgi:hypothetical protein
MNNSAAQFRREGALTVWVGESAHPEMAESLIPPLISMQSGAMATDFRAAGEGLCFMRTLWGFKPSFRVSSALVVN